MSTLPRKAVAAVTPRPAATTLVLRDASAGLEVLMVKRSPHASFMPGAFVFPGGAVDDADGDAAALAAAAEPAPVLAQRIGQVTGVGMRGAAYAVGALRECFEECGLWLGAPQADAAALAALRARLHAGEALGALAADAGLRLHTDALQPWSHWVTPVGIPKRFDTLFFVCAAPPGQQPEVDAGETTTLEWVHPPAAMAAHAEGRFPMEFATIATLRSLAPFAAGTVAQVLAYAAAQRQLPPLHPRLRLDADGHITGVLLPGDAGYDEAAGDG